MNKVMTFCVAYLATDAAAQLHYQVRDEGDAVEVVAVSTEAAPAPAPEPIPPDLPVSELVSRYIAAFRPEEKQALLERIAQSKPRSPEDLRWLLNLYNRDTPLGGPAAEASLRRLTPRDRELAPFFVALLKDDEEPFLQVFGVLGALQLRAEEALPELTRLASGKFPSEEPQLRMGPKEANLWAARFQALAALAQWRAPKARELLERQAKDAPAVAELLARHYWREALPQIVAWSEARGTRDRERAGRAWKAAVPAADLRATADALFALVGDRGKSEETRHQAALKLGFACDDALADRVLAAREKARGEKDRLLWTATLFASRHPKAVPLLTEYAKTHPEPASRAGALVQLGQMLPPAERRALFEWVLANDQDEENRELARKLLSQP